MDLKTDLNENDFPVYQHLVRLDAPGAAAAKADFEAACRGGDAEKYQFALGIQSVADIVPAGAVPGLTDEMRRKTLASCLAVFRAVAAGYSGVADAAKIMVAYGESRDFGVPRP
mgnify:CR=1 FL=1